MLEAKFRILDCFDDTIDNLNLFTSYIYVLKLVEDRYYIGRTDNILRRIEEHFTNNGSIYTKKFKPLKVIEVEEEKTREDEKCKTLDYMKKYGWEKVRGSHWCSLEIKNPPKNKKTIKRFLFENKIEPIKNSSDDEIIKMYCLENNNIIEIGEKLNKTPGSIAYSLKHFSIIEKIQHAKGYNEYIMSDLYKEICKKKNKSLHLE
jgi:predicted GIY-YIG superfamily endonuclease